MRVGASILLSILIIAATASPLWSPWKYAEQDRLQATSGITRVHPVGTDDLGRDSLVRVSAALILGLVGSIVASALATALSLCLGVLAASSERRLGKVILYAGDLLLTLPWIFLLMMVRAALPLTLSPWHSATLTFALLAVLGVPTFLRFHYTRTVAMNRSEWLLQSRASGLRKVQILRGVVPHLLPLILTQILLYIPACISAEANLGTLGLGIGEPMASWGSMLQSLQSAAFTSTSHLIYLPLVLLILVLTSLELIATASPEEKV